MAPKGRPEKEPPETLASASGKSLEGLLERVNKRRSKAGKAAARAAQKPQAVATCGAPAVLNEEEDAKPQPSHGAESLQRLQQQQQDAPEATLAVTELEFNDDDWEDVEGDEEAISEGEELYCGDVDAGGITIDLESGGSPTKKRKAAPRRTFTKEDRETAREVHRSHLLCLLGRGMLVDAAADDPLIQASAVSLVSAEAAAAVQSGGSGSAGVDTGALTAVVEGFRREFKLVGASQAAHDEDEVALALAGAQGVAGFSQQLLEVVQRRCGTAEELVAVVAAALRALGCATRVLRLLEPSSLKPADALRQQEHAMLRFMKRQRSTMGPEVIDLTAGDNEQAGPSSAAAPSAAAKTLARTATELLTGKASKQLESLRASVAAHMNITASRAIKLVPGGADGSISLIAVDYSKLRGSKKGVKRAEIVDASVKDDPPAGPSKRQGKAAVEEAETAEKGKKGSRKRKGAGEKEGGGSGKEAAIVEEEEEAGLVPLVSIREAPQPTPKRRKGDEEYERELALSLAATAFDSSKTKPGEGGSSDAEEAAEDLARGGAAGGKMEQKGGAGGGVQRRGRTRGAAFGVHQAHVGQYWLEVYCGGTADGRWVHACPLTGWVDRARDVEGLVPRGHSLAYVVAFRNGGAKDVTRRYAASFVNAEKQREGSWWDETLRPLRSKETATTGGRSSGAARTALPAAAAARAVGATGRQQQQALAELREDRELEVQAAVERKGLPTTIDGFKSHAQFILERHIGKYCALKPGAKKMGAHRGEAYYLREEVGEVHTAERWRRMGREVLAEELEHPAKRIDKRGQGGGGKMKGGLGRGGKQTKGNSNDSDDEEGEGAAAGDGAGPSGAAAVKSDFYGEWQTKAWVPPAAVGGKVPKNERGNVEVPPFSAVLPSGTVHLRLAGVAAVCRKLGVDYAPALTGFEIRGGRSVPSLEGVVVCTEHAAAVRAAHEEEEANRAERAQQKRMAEAEAAWRDLLRALLTRVRLQRSYGTGQHPADAAEEAAAMLAHTAATGKLHGAKKGAKKGAGEAAGQEKRADEQAVAVAVEEI